jgi:outer membrane receptor protein involved in Fe transport
VNRTNLRQHDGGINVQATFATQFAGRDNRFTVGAGQLKSTARFAQSSQFGYLTPDRGVATVDGPGAFADGTQDSENAFDARVELTGDTETRSIFFTDTFAISPIVHLTLSGRYDRTEVENVDGITPGGGPGSLDGDHHFDRFNPAVGLTFTPSEAFGAYLGYNEGSRAPSAIELGCADPENPCKLPNAMAGDPPLDQVVTRTYEAGVRGVVASTVAWNAGVFRADNRDDIMFVADDTSGFGFFQNFGKTRRQGVELGLNARVGAVDIGANYTFLDATYRSEEEVLGEGNSTNEEGAGFEGTIDVEPGDRIPLTPRHIFKTYAAWRILPQLSANIDLISIAGSYARGNENNEHEPDGEFYLGPGRTGGYTVVNLGIDYAPVPALTLFAQVNNLFDREYYTASQLGSTGFNAAGNFVARPFAGPIVDGERPLLGSTFQAPGAPRAYWAGVRYSFGK